MAMRLLRAGHTVAVYNRSAPPIDALVAAGAVHGETPRIAAEDAEIVIAMVRDDEASRAIWCDHRDGALKGLGTGAIAIESSTLTPCWVSELRRMSASPAPPSSRRRSSVHGRKPTAVN